jgi:hypothetical protein
MSAPTRVMVRPKRIVTRRSTNARPTVHGTDSQHDDRAMSWCGTDFVVRRWYGHNEVRVQIVESNQPITCRLCRRTRVGREEP